MAQRVLEALAQQELPQGQDLTLRTLSLTAGQPLFEAEALQPHVYLVSSGLLKLHYLQPDGSEWIKSFAGPGKLIGSLRALQPGGRTSFAVAALEDSRLERLDYGQLEALARQQPAWLAALYQAMRALALQKEQRERELLSLTPAERYAAFVAQEPALAARIALKDLARYLGITPVSLSRIRARQRAA